MSEKHIHYTVSFFFNTKKIVQILSRTLTCNMYRQNVNATYTRTYALKINYSNTVYTVNYYQSICCTILLLKIEFYVA